MEKEWYNTDQNETMAKHSRYLRSYHNLLEESVSLLSPQHQQHHLQQIEDVLQFETKFAKVSPIQLLMHFYFSLSNKNAVVESS